MTEVRVLDAVELRRIVDFVSALSWPAPVAEAKRMGESLGWTIDLDRKRGIDFLTAYPIDSPYVSVMYDGDNVGQVSIDASDDVDVSDAAALRASVRELRQRVTAILGEPVHVRQGANARFTWDLDNGGRLAAASVDRVVQLIVLQRAYADIERAEESLDIPEDRDPRADLD